MSIAIILNGEPKLLVEHGDCPACGKSWDDGDILENLIALRDSPPGGEFYKHKTDEDLRKIAGYYGWSPENPRRFSKVIGVELPYGHPDRYDGVSFWRCPHCDEQWPRAFFPTKE